MELLDYDGAVEVLQGTLTSIKDNVFDYFVLPITAVKGFGPIAFVEAGVHNTGGNGGSSSSSGGNSGTTSC